MLLRQAWPGTCRCTPAQDCRRAQDAQGCSGPEAGGSVRLPVSPGTRLLREWQGRTHHSRGRGRLRVRRQGLAQPDAIAARSPQPWSGPLLRFEVMNVLRAPSTRASPPRRTGAGFTRWTRNAKLASLHPQPEDAGMEERRLLRRCGFSGGNVNRPGCSALDDIKLRRVRSSLSTRWIA